MAAARARLLELAARIVVFEAEIDGEARRIAEQLGEPADYDDFLEERAPGSPHHEIYRCASCFELDECAARDLVRAAMAREDELLAEWKQRRAEHEERARGWR